MTATTTRTRKTPDQRAAETLGTARRLAERARKKHNAAALALEEARNEWNAARSRLSYAASDPALPDTVREEALEWIDERDTEDANDREV